MVRRTAAVFAFAMAAASVLVVGAVAAPAGASDSGPVLAGTFQGQLRMTKTDHNMAGYGTKGGPRTMAFGQGCPISQGCSASFSSGGASRSQPVSAQGGGLGWSAHQPVGCVDRATRALRTSHGWDADFTVQLHPSATTTRNGVTYVTALTGTLVSTLNRTGAGASNNCTLDPDRVPNASERGVYVFRLVPLAAPKATSSTPPIALPPAATKPTTSTIPGFRLPQTDDQRASARAVALGTRSSVPGALVTPSQAAKSIGSRLPQDLLLVAVLGLLIIFPAQLFNSTYESNHERIDRQLAKLRFLRRRPRAPLDAVAVVPAQATGEPAAPAAPPAVPPAGPTVASRGRRLTIFFGCAVLGTLLAGFLDPKFGANTASYALVSGVFASVLITVLVVVLAGRVYRSLSHNAKDWYLEAIPSALLIAVVCVVVSRLTHFQPGYLYGVLGGAVFVSVLERRSEGRAEVAVGVVALVLALGAWFAFEPVSQSASHADASYPTLALDSLLACLFIGGLEGLLFGLIPLRFLPGARIKNWSWIAWGLLTAVVAYVFVHVLLMPESGYLGRSTAASVTLTIVLFGAFAVASVLFWGYFRLRPTPEEPPDATGEAALEALPAEGMPAPSRVPVDTQGETVAGDTPPVPQQSGPVAGEQS